MESKINELYEINEQANAHITSLKEENRILEANQATQQQTARVDLYKRIFMKVLLDFLNFKVFQKFLVLSWMDHTDAWVRRHQMNQQITSPPQSSLQQQNYQQMPQLHAVGNSKSANLPGFGILEQTERAGFEHKLRRIFHSKNSKSKNSHSKSHSFSSTISSHSSSTVVSEGKQAKMQGFRQLNGYSHADPAGANNSQSQPNQCHHQKVSKNPWRNPSFYKKVSYFLKKRRYPIFRREHIPYSEEIIFQVHEKYYFLD